LFVCRNCGCEYVPQAERGPKSEFCSQGCRAWHRSGLKPDKDGLLHLECGHCGKRFETKHKRKYCCRSCQESAGRFRENKICAVCSKEFTAKTKGAKTCSPVCSQRMRSIRDRRRFTCTNCDKQFYRKSGNSAGLFCSRICFFSWKKKSNGKPVRYPLPITNGSTHRRRAKRFGVAHESVKASSIFERDQWVCKLCGCEVDRYAIAPQPNAPTIDHIIPISRGGPHVPSNLQCAHWRCNLRKGSKT
jgi:hypothetical protein